MFRDELDAQLVQTLGHRLDSLETDSSVVSWEDCDLFGDSALQGMNTLDKAVDGGLDLGLGDLVQS